MYQNDTVAYYMPHSKGPTHHLHVTAKPPKFSMQTVPSAVLYAVSNRYNIKNMISFASKKKPIETYAVKKKK